jgi:LysM repeat protein
MKAYMALAAVLAGLMVGCVPTGRHAWVATAQQQPPVHVVEQGQDLASIAMMYMTTTNDLMKTNNLTSEKILPGQKLVIPARTEENE